VYCGSTPVVFGGYDGLVDVRTSTVRGCEMVTSWPPWPANTIAIGSRWATASPEEARGDNNNNNNTSGREAEFCLPEVRKLQSLQIAEGRPFISGFEGTLAHRMTRQGVGCLSDYVGSIEDNLL